MYKIPIILRSLLSFELIYIRNDFLHGPHFTNGHYGSTFTNEFFITIKIRKLGKLVILENLLRLNVAILFYSSVITIFITQVPGFLDYV